MTMTAATIPADARAERAADRTGVQTAEVERLPFDLSVLEDEGLFVNVDGRGFGLLDRRLDWEALGLSLPSETDIAFRPPRCGLLPDCYRLPLLRPPTPCRRWPWLPWERSRWCVRPGDPPVWMTGRRSASVANANR